MEIINPQSGTPNSSGYNENPSDPWNQQQTVPDTDYRAPIAPEPPRTPLIDNDIAPVIKIGDWFLTIFLIAIPIVNLIVLLVWAFGSGNNPNKVNFAKANLIWMLIAIVLTLVFWSMIFGVARGLMN